MKNNNSEKVELTESGAQAEVSGEDVLGEKTVTPVNDELKQLAKSVAEAAENADKKIENRETDKIGAHTAGNVSDAESDQVQKDYAYELFGGEKIIERQSLKQLMDSYLQSVAYTERLKAELENIKKSSSVEQIFNNPEYVKKAAENDAVEKIVIEKYLKKLAGGGSVEMLGSGVGTGTAAVIQPPKTLKEAKRIADIMMRS